MSFLRELSVGLREVYAGLPQPARFTVAGAVLGAVLGGTAGLVIGLQVHPATAWFAVLEVGIPSALVAGLLGLAAGSVVRTLQRKRP